MPDRELYEKLFAAQTHGGNNFYAQFANANQSLRALRDMGDLDKESEQFKRMKGVFDAQKGQAVVGSALSAFNGATGILNNSLGAAQIADTSSQRGMLEDVRNIGSGNYNSFNQLSSEYDSLNSIQPDLSYDTIRGGSAGQRAGNVASSALSGASAGMQIGGPWGAAIGGVVGLGAGIAGVLAGAKKAKIEQENLQTKAMAAQDAANRNLADANENLLNKQFNAGYRNRAALGGRIIRKHGDGGTIIRIKR